MNESTNSHGTVAFWLNLLSGRDKMKELVWRKLNGLRGHGRLSGAFVGAGRLPPWFGVDFVQVIG